MSEANHKINQHLAYNLPYAGTIVNRPEYKTDNNYLWRQATVRHSGMTARPGGQRLEVAVCPEDSRFCIINNKQKSTIRTDALDFELP